MLNVLISLLFYQFTNRSIFEYVHRHPIRFQPFLDSTANVSSDMPIELDLKTYDFYDDILNLDEGYNLIKLQMFFFHKMNQMST